jgi:hypothetical protein
MGMIKSNARSGIGERPTSIKRIGSLKLALGALALLMVSGVLAQSGGGYALDPWVVANGGAISSSGGGYSLGSTIGQAGAGTVSGGSYTIYGGFWRPGTVVKAPPSPIYVPLVRHSPPPPPPPPPPAACPDVEPNNIPQQGRPLTTINGSCNGSFQNEPAGNFDYYSIQPKINQRIIVKLTGIPAGADYDIALIRQDSPTVYNTVRASATLGRADELIDFIADSSNRYFVRVKLTTKSPSATNTYILAVAIT